MRQVLDLLQVLRNQSNPLRPTTAPASKYPTSMENPNRLDTIPAVNPAVRMIKRS